MASVIVWAQLATVPRELAEMYGLRWQAERETALRNSSLGESAVALRLAAQSKRFAIQLATSSLSKPSSMVAVF